MMLCPGWDSEMEKGHEAKTKNPNEVSTLITMCQYLLIVTNVPYSCQLLVIGKIRGRGDGTSVRTTSSVFLKS